MPTQEEFISAATSATRETHNAVPFGPSNTKKVTGKAASRDVIELVNQSQSTQGLFIKSFGNLGEAQLISARASIARATKAANCGGMTCIAFNFVRIYSPHIRPMAFVNVDGKMNDDTHSFVAFNLPVDPHEKLNNWGSDVVICDPWLVWIIKITGASATPLEKEGVFRPESHAEWVDMCGYNPKYTSIQIHVQEGE